MYSNTGICCIEEQNADAIERKCLWGNHYLALHLSTPALLKLGKTDSSKTFEIWMFNLRYCKTTFQCDSHTLLQLIMVSFSMFLQAYFVDFQREHQKEDYVVLGTDNSPQDLTMLEYVKFCLIIIIIVCLMLNWEGAR